MDSRRQTHIISQGLYGQKYFYDNTKLLSVTLSTFVMGDTKQWRGKLCLHLNQGSGTNAVIIFDYLACVRACMRACIWIGDSFDFPSPCELPSCTLKSQTTILSPELNMAYKSLNCLICPWVSYSYGSSTCTYMSTLLIFLSICTLI